MGDEKAVFLVNNNLRFHNWLKFEEDRRLKLLLFKFVIMW